MSISKTIWVELLLPEYLERRAAVLKSDVSENRLDTLVRDVGVNRESATKWALLIASVGFIPLATAIGIAVFSRNDIKDWLMIAILLVAGFMMLRFAAGHKKWDSVFTLGGRMPLTLTTPEGFEEVFRPVFDGGGYVGEIATDGNGALVTPLSHQPLRRSVRGLPLLNSTILEELAVWKASKSQIVVVYGEQPAPSSNSLPLLSAEDLEPTEVIPMIPLANKRGGRKHWYDYALWNLSEKQLVEVIERSNFYPRNTNSAIAKRRCGYKSALFLAKRVEEIRDTFAKLSVHSCPADLAEQQKLNKLCDRNNAMNDLIMHLSLDAQTLETANTLPAEVLACYQKRVSIKTNEDVPSWLNNSIGGSHKSFNAPLEAAARGLGYITDRFV